jgi:DNA modification methylase
MMNVINWTMKNGDELKIAEKVFNDEILVSKAEFGVKILSREDYGIEQENDLKALCLFFNGKIKPNDILFALDTLARPDYSYESEKELKALKCYFNKTIDKNDVDKHIHNYNEKMGKPFTSLQISKFEADKYRIIPGDVLSNPLPSDILVDLCLTSVPYWQQVIYGGSEFEIGREKTPEQYINNICSIFSNNINQIKDSGVIVVNINESFKDGQCVGVVPMFIMEMKNRGFIYIQTCIWDKNKTGKPKGGNNVKRLGNQFEYILIFAKSKNYYFNQLQLKNDKKKCTVTSNCKEQSKATGTHVSNRYDTVCDVISQNFISDIMVLNQTSGRSQTEFGLDFFGSFPTLFPIPFILTFSPENGVVWDPCGGSGTVGRQSLFLGRSAVISELYEKNVKNISKLLEEGVKSFNKEEFEFFKQKLGVNPIDEIEYELVA